MELSPVSPGRHEKCLLSLIASCRIMFRSQSQLIPTRLSGLSQTEAERRKKKLWSEQGRAQLEKLPLAPWASRRRKDLLELLDRMNPTIEALTAAVEREAKKWPEVQRLMTHPGVGPLTALAFVLIIGTPERFPCGKQIGSYVGLIPSEDSSAGKQRLGRISKQGSSLLRFLLGEAAQAAARGDADWRRRYVHLAMRRQKNIAKVAMAEDSRSGCTGCGGTAGSIRSG
jgi:transposase